MLSDEQRRFRGLLERGRGLVGRHLRNGPLTESDLRYLHETHGLPPELVRSLVEKLQR